MLSTLLKKWLCPFETMQRTNGSPEKLTNLLHAAHVAFDMHNIVYFFQTK